MTDESEKKKNVGDSNYHRLWIDTEWYIPIDNTGLCVGMCFEGSLGFVIQLLSLEPSERRMALKLPRLLGETHRENAYISDLMEKELHVVREIFSGEDKPTGLLTAQVGQGSPLRGPISTEGGTPEAQRWNDAIVLVRYEKGQNPRFCLVKKEGKKIEYFPKEAYCPIKTVEVFDKLKEHAKNEKTHREWSKTVFLIDDGVEMQIPDQAGSNNQPEILSIEGAFGYDPIGKTWYTSIPSIKYGWASGTLQEAISLGRRGQWDITKHLELVENICRGLNTLHSKKMLHADVRPANIVYQRDPTNPANYSLSDYGSFAETGARAADHSPPTGGTVGPVVGGERTSAFYAPERRTGREREAADTAVIIDPGDGTRLYIVLGWRSDLIDSQTRKPKDDVKKYTDRTGFVESKREVSGTLLQKGDRIQIREYIFELVNSERNVEDKQILDCINRFWKIYHGRIVVESTTADTFKPIDWFPIPRTVELLQWSASTDLYSGMCQAC